MSITYEERSSGSPYVETIMHGRTLSDDSPVRPAECHWHMVFVRKDGEARVIYVGPWTTAGFTYYTAGAEILWVKFKLGTFMPHLPTSNFLDAETILPEAASRSFWLKGSAWQFPDHENAETFVEKLVRNERPEPITTPGRRPCKPKTETPLTKGRDHLRHRLHRAAEKMQPRGLNAREPDK